MAAAGTLLASEEFSAEPDILFFRTDGAVDVLEIKTATGIKGRYLDELAWNVELLTRSGIRPGEVSLLHLNGGFVEGETAKPAELFITADVTKRVFARTGGVGKTMSLMRKVLSGEDPPSRLPYCSSGGCPFGDLCGLPRHSVFSLHQGRLIAEELVRGGIMNIEDIPPGTRLSRKQRIQVDAALSGKPYLDASSIETFLSGLHYPLSFLDFETFSTALPPYDGISPWEHVPFQFSLHVLSEPVGIPARSSFLADEREDPRPAFLRALHETLPGKGSLVVYNRRFEAGILGKLGSRFPEYEKWCGETVARMEDLLTPFADFRYYHPDQQGRVSMKKVLPALTGRGYGDFRIRNGEAANAAFAGMLLRSRAGCLASEDRELLRGALEEYCSLDTEGMILILRELERKVRS